MLVEHTGCPQWGPGKIVCIGGDNMHVIFRDCEEDMAKLLRTDFPALQRQAYLLALLEKHWRLEQREQIFAAGANA